ncbi:hypothetical protein [Deinococcus gobiensis]|uniref:Uncharacterized protein n=1 Tax=Deinococcus gobiensis (strain DSM 21396 / JCM 16679 / CGMCC 1.7299 / I-0) TaxID=745776 RepID=H8H256_DEIGI|nr:hypothetical protein [Deinococcus gobiensis]AFD27603.1 hypothetical protein DGo_PB0334 [Deinococcus gobiensis I-0]
MASPLLLASLMAFAPAGAPFPWSGGYPDPGTTFAQPLQFVPFTNQPAPPPQGWSRAPLTLTAHPIWSAQPLADLQAQLTPGPTWLQDKSWRAPLALRLNTPTSAVVQLVREGKNLGNPLAINPAVQVPATFGPGQTFLRLDNTTEYRRQGQSLPPSQLAGRVLTLVRTAGEKATFSVPGLGEVERLGRAGDGFPDLAPLVADPALAALKRTYEGKEVWGYGGLGSQCDVSKDASMGVNVPLCQGVRVLQVARLGKPLFLNAQGSFGDDVGRGADAIALTPLVFLLDSTPFQSNGSFSSSAPFEEEDTSWLEQATDPGNCGVAVPIYLPDTWTVQRVFSLTPPSDQVPQDRPEDPHGLTRWQYAWLAGFPSSMFGTVSELLKTPEWKYRNIPFPATVSFDAQGRVQEVRVPRLP